MGEQGVVTNYDSIVAVIHVSCLIDDHVSTLSITQALCGIRA